MLANLNAEQARTAAQLLMRFPGRVRIESGSEHGQSSASRVLTFDAHRWTIDGFGRATCLVNDDPDTLDAEPVVAVPRSAALALAALAEQAGDDMTGIREPANRARLRTFAECLRGAVDGLDVKWGA